jgi:hypothetical protein
MVLGLDWSGVKGTFEPTGNIVKKVGLSLPTCKKERVRSNYDAYHYAVERTRDARGSLG